jgi:serine/threonine protein kinase
VELGWNEVIRPEQLIFGAPLGAGGSAQVYRGSWQGQEVAIKKISGVAHLEEMTKEINALRRLRHPRLVRFIGACIQPPLLLVLTEFMAGGSLHDRLFDQKGKNQSLTSAQRGCIAVQMAEGLTYLHGQRIVHRDMKSMNILLDTGGNAKLCDFGLAQQMNMEATHITRKSEGEGGSPRYMAPECYDPRHGKLSEKVDIWALGCIFIEVFGNVLPYADCMSMAQLSARILVQKQPPQCPTTVAPTIRGVIASCFNFNPDNRPTASDLHRQIQQSIN